MATELQKLGEGATRAALEHATTGLQLKEPGINTATTQLELIAKTSTGTFLHFASLERFDDYGAGASGALLIGVEDDNFQQITGDTNLQATLKSIDTAIDSLSSVSVGGFTQGSVLFADSGGNLDEDNSNFFWDNSNNRLGIGTDSPGVSLDVVYGTSGHYARFYGTSTYHLRLGEDGAGVQYIDALNGVATLDFRTNASSRVTINSAGLMTAKSGMTLSANSDLNLSSTSDINCNSGDLYWDSGNARLGLGTGSPTSTIDLTGSHTVTGGAVVLIDPDMTLSGVSSGALMRVGVTGSHSIITDGTSRVYSLLGGLEVSEPNISLQAGDTVTTAYTLRVSSAPTEGTNNYSLLVDGGESRFDGNINLNTNADLKGSSTSDIVWQNFKVNGSTSKVEIGGGALTTELLNVGDPTGDARISINAATAFDAEIKFFENSIIEYTIGHDSATSKFVIGGANVDAPLLTVGKSGETTLSTLDIGSSVVVTGVLDEDTMSSNSAVKLATQQSIKAYVDNSVGGTSGTFTATLTGCTTSPTVTMSYTISGKIVTLFLPSSGFEGTSNTTALSFTGLPASIQPNTPQGMISTRVKDNGSLIESAQLFVTGSQVQAEIWTGSGYSPTGWTNTGTKGFGVYLSLTYSIY